LSRKPHVALTILIDLHPDDPRGEVDDDGKFPNEARARNERVERLFGNRLKSNRTKQQSGTPQADLDEKSCLVGQALQMAEPSAVIASPMSSSSNTPE